MGQAGEYGWRALRHTDWVLVNKQATHLHGLFEPVSVIGLFSKCVSGARVHTGPCEFL